MTARKAPVHTLVLLSAPEHTPNTERGKITEEGRQHILSATEAMAQAGIRRAAVFYGAAPYAESAALIVSQEFQRRNRGIPTTQLFAATRPSDASNKIVHFLETVDNRVEWMREKEVFPGTIILITAGEHIKQVVGARTPAPTPGSFVLYQQQGAWADFKNVLKKPKLSYTPV